jgi:Tfp pilus assembly protein PilF
MERAKDCYQKALEIDSTDETALVNYATFLHIVKNDTAGADEYYQKALKVDPDHAGILGNYAQFLIEHENLYQSLNYLKQAFEQNKGLGLFAEFNGQLAKRVGMV